MGRLTAAVRECGSAGANQVLFSTLATVLDFADGCPPEDDLTLLVIRRRESIMTGPSPSRGTDSVSPGEPTSVIGPKKAERRVNRSK